MSTTETVRAGSSTRWTLAGQVLLNVVLVSAVAWIGFTGNHRARFFAPLVPLLFAPFSYARVRLQRSVERHVPRSSAVLIAAVAFLCDATMVAQLLDARQPFAVPLLETLGVEWLGEVWYSAYALLFVCYAMTGLLRAATWPLRRRRALRPAEPEETDAILMGRRELLQRGGLLAAALPFGVSLSGVSVSYDFRVERREIVLPRWPRALDGLVIAHLSDIHVGGEMNRERLRRVAELTNAGHADLVLHTGDFLTHRSGDFDAPLYEALSRIHAPYGQWASLGNHDFDDVSRFMERLRDSGVGVLRDRKVDLSIQDQPVELAGLDFQFHFPGGVSTYGNTIATFGERSAVPRILLNHDPTSFHELPANCADIVLSGHLHGGQIGVQLSQSHAITVVGLAGLPDQGVFSREQMKMYVTRGVGFYGYPMRIGIPPEIALLVLRSPSSV
ncbi:MAG: metallophosphoesterase [Deltaproteobacteria bacterium]|nr:metallophosphoesterase [Deltaproteobacteria bacterium]